MLKIIQNLSVRFYYNCEFNQLIRTKLSMTINPLLDEISNFLSAVINIYPELPKDLNEQIKTMQAFLRCYDEKELFLIQNFVKRLQTKAQKIRYLNKKKNMKTQPNTNDQNKQNHIQLMNIQHKNYTHHFDSLTSLDRFEGNNNNKEKNKPEYIQDKTINRYKNLFNAYSSKNNQNSERPLSMPKEKSPIPSLYSSREQIKPKSSPYLQASTEYNQSVNCSSSWIEPDFSNIHLQEIKPYNQQQNRLKITQMQKAALQTRQLLQNNKEILLLELCIEPDHNDSLVIN